MKDEKPQVFDLQNVRKVVSLELTRDGRKLAHLDNGEARDVTNTPKAVVELEHLPDDEE